MKIKKYSLNFKNWILTTITAVMGMMFVLSICLMDSERLEIPIGMFLVSLLWITIFCRANKFLKK